MLGNISRGLLRGSSLCGRSSRLHGGIVAGTRCFGSSKAPDTPLSETVRDFLEPADLYNVLKENGMDFYAGVPDSLLKDYCAYVTDNAPKENHVITANEGSAVGIASGYHMATRRHPIVYMQNSGFGNTVNPLLSLADPKVYSIPMLLLIGWRGEPGKKDEPQHVVQGKVMSAMLADCNIQFDVLPDYIEGATEAVEMARHYLEKRKGPYALLVKRQTFTPYKMQSSPFSEEHVYEFNREEALGLIMPHTNSHDVFVSTTGFTSRELYEHRANNDEGHKKDFLTVGSMGHASSIALGIALRKPSRQVFCIDGDGAAVMHMGNFVTVGNTGCANFKHILINNGCHDSVGGQPTQGFDIDFPSVASASGYKWVKRISTKEEVPAAMKELRAVDGPAFLEIRVNAGARKDLGRPKTSPIENKEDFMSFLDG